MCPKPDLTHNHTPPPFNEEFYKRPSGSSEWILFSDFISTMEVKDVKVCYNKKKNKGG